MDRIRMSKHAEFHRVTPADLFRGSREPGASLLFPHRNVDLRLLRLRNHIEEGRMRFAPARPQVLEGVSHAPAAAEKGGTFQANINLNVGNLAPPSGGKPHLLVPFYRFGRFTQVSADWIVPNVAYPIISGRPWAASSKTGKKSKALYCTPWVSFGNLEYKGGQFPTNTTPGDQLWQAGTMSLLKINGGKPFTQAWFEVPGKFGSGDTTALQGFPVWRGDHIHVRIIRLGPNEGKGNGSCQFLIVNLTAWVYTEFIFTCADFCYGQSVSWTVERNGEGAQEKQRALPYTPRFGSVYFDNAQCTYEDADTLAEHNPAKHSVVLTPGEFTPTTKSSVPSALRQKDNAGTSIYTQHNQLDANGVEVVTSELLADNLIRCDYVYPLDAGTPPGTMGVA